MSKNDPERLGRYVRMIAAKHGGLEGLRHKIGEKLQAYEESGFESVGGTAGDGKATAARKAIEQFELGKVPPPEQIEGLEAIIDAEIRPVIDIVNGKFQSTHPLWTQLSTDTQIRARLEDSLASIGRIELPGHPRLPYGGTGFIVGDGLVMTNRHVAEIFASGLGTRALQLKPNASAGIDFLRELKQPPGQVFEVRRIVMIHPYWDMAILEVNGLSGRRTLKLALQDARDLEGREIAVIGYPAFDPRNPADVQRGLFNGNYGVKRLQPGEIRGRITTGSFGKLVPAASHDCSTLGGNSGSALIDLSTGFVLALHFGGSYREQNYAVPAFELARDPRVTEAGVVFDGTPTSDATDWAQWWSRADEGEGTSLGADGRDDARVNVQPGDSSAGDRRSLVAGASARTGDTDRTLDVEIPIIVSVSVGHARPAGASERQASARAVESVAADELEAMQEPFHDTTYSNRRGYDPDFLNAPGSELGPVSVPMPTASDPTVLAQTNDGDDVLHYQNFSIRMHAKRRLAFVTACNVTTEPKLRRPETGKDYTRKGLSGLGKNDMEEWFRDKRLKDDFQIPDVFFTKDRKAFDKGHIVRRDDVAWGKTYAALRRANGDSYHVTNCSPQVAGFNQSAKGDANWGDLENHVLSEAASERLCVFAGPVLHPDDRVFHGVGGGGTALRARIPSRFWKVIVARVPEGIASFGFVLEQDLSNVDFEFVPGEDFVPVMRPIVDIAKMTGMEFAPAVVAADQFDAVRGIEIVQRSGARRG
jgi:endonuclease G